MSQEECYATELQIQISPLNIYHLINHGPVQSETSFNTVCLQHLIGIAEMYKLF